MKLKIFGKEITIDNKLLHQIGGTLISVLFSWLFYFFTEHGIILSGIFGFFVSIITGVVKELYDKYIKKTEFSIMDVAITASGGSVGMILFFMVFGYLTTH